MIRNLAIGVFAIVVTVSAAPAAPRAAPAEQDSLGRVLEGLAPAPRIAYLRYLLRTRPDDPEIYFQLGVAYHEAENADSAFHFYEKAVALSPRLSKAYVNMGVLYDGRNDRDDALKMFEKAAEVNPNDLLANAHAAYALFGKGDYEAAMTHLRRALAIDPLDPQPHYYLAIFFWECGMFKESLVEWEKVVAYAPKSELATKALENITVLQQALLAPAGENVPPPEP